MPTYTGDRLCTRCQKPTWQRTSMGAEWLCGECLRTVMATEHMPLVPLQASGPRVISLEALTLDLVELTTDQLRLLARSLHKRNLLPKMVRVFEEELETETAAQQKSCRHEVPIRQYFSLGYAERCVEVQTSCRLCGYKLTQAELDQARAAVKGK